MGKGGGGEEEGRAMLLHGRRAQIYTPTAALFAKTVNMRSDLEARTTTLHRRIIEWAVAFRIPNSENTWLQLSKADAKIDEQTIICKVCKAAGVVSPFARGIRIGTLQKCQLVQHQGMAIHKDALTNMDRPHRAP